MRHHSIGIGIGSSNRKHELIESKPPIRTYLVDNEGEKKPWVKRKKNNKNALDLPTAFNHRIQRDRISWFENHIWPLEIEIGEIDICVPTHSK